MAGISFSMQPGVICLSKTLCKQMLKRLSLLKNYGTPMMARLQLPETGKNKGHYMCTIDRNTNQLLSGWWAGARQRTA